MEIYTQDIQRREVRPAELCLGQFDLPCRGIEHNTLKEMQDAVTAFEHAFDVRMYLQGLMENHEYRIRVTVFR